MKTTNLFNIRIDGTKGTRGAEINAIQLKRKCTYPSIATKKFQRVSNASMQPKREVYIKQNEHLRTTQVIHEVDKLARRLPALDIILIQGQIESFFAARNSRRKLKQTQKSIRFSPGKEWSRRKRHLRSLKGGIRGRPERAGDRGADVVVDEEDDLRRRLHLAVAPQGSGCRSRFGGGLSSLANRPPAHCR